jgi:VanZ family protein
MTCVVEGCDRPSARVRGAAINLVGNIVLFLPFGLLSSVAMEHRKRAAWARILLVFGAGLALSATVEMVQLWLPTRSTSLTDVVLNGSGALLGATFAAVRPYRRSKSPVAAPGNAPAPAVSL